MSRAARVGRLSGPPGEGIAESFWGAFRSSPDACALSTLEEGRYVEVNDGFTRLLGFAREELLGRPAVETVWPSPGDREAFLRTLEGGTAFREREVELRTKSGERRTFSISAEAVDVRGRRHLMTISRDVTDQKLMTEALRASEERYRNFLALSTDAIGRIELSEGLAVDLPEEEQLAHIWRHAYVAECNDAMARGSGLASAADVLGRRLAEVLPDSPEERNGLLRFIRSGHRLIDDELCRVGRDGQARWLRRNVLGVMSGAQLIRAWVVTRDETARKRAEVAVDEQRAFLRQVLDSNPHLIFARDGHNRITLANRATAELYGTTVEALTGEQGAGAAPPPGVVESFNLGEVETLVSGGERAFRTAVRDAAGGLRRFDVVERPLLDPQGAAHQVISVATDVTARLRADEERNRLQTALEHAAREWRETFDAIDVGILVTNDSGRVVRVNREAAALAEGCREYESLLHRRLEAIGAQEPWRTAEQVREAAARQTMHIARQIRDEATARAWYITASPMKRGAGAAPWVIVTLRDITAETEVEQQLRRSRQMEAMGALVAGVAHEVRTPLFSISATLEAFESEFGVRPEQEEYAVLLRSQVRRLTQLMSDLLDYGKPPVLSLSPGGIDEVVRRALQACRGLAKQSKVSLTLALEENLPPVRRDPGRLEQVFQNLIANAIQHSPPGAAVGIGVGRAPQGRGGVCCTVEDRGSGVPNADRRRIFEPFVSGRKGGTGLGLSIVQRIVDGHGGTVTAGSRPDGGAVFTVVLPAGEEDAQAGARC
ncbi:MAG TPA: PAS domain S-box protein [Vicinamibacteria bacterium]|nr:PAS domain S-box protein [Vicinamibacteria bacterium]